MAATYMLWAEIKQRQSFPVSMLRNTDLWQVCSRQYLLQLQVSLLLPVTQAAQINSCDSYLMSSLAAVFIGRSVGGAERPNALGTVVGALLISTLENGLTMCGVVYYVLPAVKGAVLCLALVAAYITVKED